MLSAKRLIFRGSFGVLVLLVAIWTRWLFVSTDFPYLLARAEIPTGLAFGCIIFVLELPGLYFMIRGPHERKVKT